MSQQNDEVTPARFLTVMWSWAGVVITVGLLLAALFLGLWRAHLWLWAQGNQARYTATIHSQQYQQSLLAEMQQHLSNITDTGTTRATVPAGSAEQVNLRAQQLSEVRGLCANSLTFIPEAGVPADTQMQATVTANCDAGAPIVNPPLANPIPPAGG